MKKLIKGSLEFILACAVLFGPFTALQARQARYMVGGVAPQDNQPKGDEIKISDSKILDAGEVSKRVDEFRKGKAGAALDEFLRQKGYAPGDGQEAFFGVDIFFKGGDGKEAKVSLVLQDYARSGSASLGDVNQGDQGAIAFATSSSGEHSSTYSFVLFGDGKGGLEKATEFYANDQSSVVPAHSWWTCFTGNLQSRCSGVCSAAISSCRTARTYAAFFNCIVRSTQCVGCALGVIACCTCNCNWWCSWACGCCRI